MGMKRYVFFIICLIAFSPHLMADEDRVLVQLMPFSVYGMGRDEAEILEALIQSYIIDLDDSTHYETIINDPSSQAEIANPDYIITGSITRVDGERVLTLELVNTQTGEMSQFTSNHQTASDLALRSRSLVREALAGGSGTIPRENSEAIRANSIAGTWKGDQGIEMIRLQRNGSGMALFSSGLILLTMMFLPLHKHPQTWTVFIILYPTMSQKNWCRLPNR